MLTECQDIIADRGNIDEVFNLLDDQSLIITSKNFPEKCCVDVNYLINYIGSKNQHIRLEFTDIDIPLGSSILVCEFI